MIVGHEHCFVRTRGLVRRAPLAGLRAESTGLAARPDRRGARCEPGGRQPVAGDGSSRRCRCAPRTPPPGRLRPS